MESYDAIEQEHITTPKEMENFLNDIKAVCVKYGLSISHEGVFGSFEIEKYSDNNIEWLFNAHKRYDQPIKISKSNTEGQCIEEEDTNPNAIFNNDEIVKIWLSKLLTKYNKKFTIYLTIDEINNEIEEVKGTISNERLWSHTNPIHLGNISTLEKYLKLLNEILEERKTFEQNKLNGGNEEC